MNHLKVQREPGAIWMLRGQGASEGRRRWSRLTSARSAHTQLVTLTRNNGADRRSGEHT